MLFVFNHAPHAINAQSFIDFMLVAASYDQHVEVLFNDTGVLQLLNHQIHPQKQRLYTKAYKAMSLYEITEVYVDQLSLNQYGMQSCDLDIEVKCIATSEKLDLFNRFDHVFQQPA